MAMFAKMSIMLRSTMAVYCWREYESQLFKDSNPVANISPTKHKPSSTEAVSPIWKVIAIKCIFYIALIATKMQAMKKEAKRETKIPSRYW